MKKLKGMITSRVVMTGLSLLIQLAVIFAMTLWFSNFWTYYLLVSYILAVVLCVRIINKRTNSGYKIGWMLLITVLPIFGSFMYITINGESFRSVTQRRLNKIFDSSKSMLGDGDKIDFDSESAGRQSDYIMGHSASVPVRNTRSRYFSSGEEYFAALLEDLRSAQHHIYLEYFILRSGYMWEEIKKILTEKAANGVDIRIIVDDFGSIDGINRRERRELERANIRLKFFNPFVPVISGLINNRDHRKICVIDTEIAYCGGINVADEYINMYERFGYFKDSGIALYGEAAYNFEVFFLSLWEYVAKEKTEIVKPRYDIVDKGVFHPYADSPIDNEYVSKTIYMNMISRAEKYVYISTPYFVVDDEMLTAITSASKSGVDVRIVVPHIPDKILVNQVTKSFYTRLIDAGVRVYEYKKGFNHSKLVLTDDKIATVGSVNFDYRSFYLSFECGVWMYNTDAVTGIKNDLLSMMEESKEITEDKARVNIFLRLFRGVLAAFSPML